MELSDKVALVTGGASGIGRATAIELASAGAEVVVADVQEQEGRAVAEQVGGHFVRTDVSSLGDNRAAAAFATKKCGGIDLAFLNAGVATGCSIGDDFDLELYRRAMAINLDGVIFGAHVMREAMLARGGGSIVATASMAGLTAAPLDPIYAANKHAVVGLTRALGPVLAAEGIRFNAVCPAFAESGIVAPVRETLTSAGFRIMPTEQVSRTVRRIFESDGSGECWFVQFGRESEPFRFRNVPGPRPAPQGDPA